MDVYKYIENILIFYLYVYDFTDICSICFDNQLLIANFLSMPIDIRYFINISVIFSEILILT